MNNLHPGIKTLWRIEGYGGLIIFVIILLIQFFSKRVLGSSFSGIIIGLVLGVLFIVIFFTEIYVQMAYKRWKYEITQTEIKIEKGIIWKKYTSIPYERVQNVDIKRGIIARMLGFSIVDIETAGRSGMRVSYGKYGRRKRYESEGHIPAVSVEGAEMIRDFVVKKISTTEGAGL
jgi:membrane protein YdbS with pleckstrin-like domain